MKQLDMFGKPKERAPRGWTELDRIRRRHAHLLRKLTSGEASEREMNEERRLRDTIVRREQEAREKWAKSFKA